MLWPPTASARATSADGRSVGKETRIDKLEQDGARTDERFKSIMETLNRIEAKVDAR